MLLTYSSLISAADSGASRLQQLVDWCGPAFEGLVVFDGARAPFQLGCCCVAGSRTPGPCLAECTHAPCPGDLQAGAEPCGTFACGCLWSMPFACAEGCKAPVEHPVVPRTAQVLSHGKTLHGARAECHKAKNLVPDAGGRPTKVGEKVLQLQRALPNARVVYCSATGRVSGVLESTILPCSKQSCGQ